MDAEAEYYKNYSERLERENKRQTEELHRMEYLAQRVKRYLKEAHWDLKQPGQKRVARYAVETAMGLIEDMLTLPKPKE